MTHEQRIAAITARMQQALAPSKLEVLDEGHQHEGHLPSGGPGHYAIVIASPKFAEKSRVQCHQLIYAELNDLMGAEIHALRIQIVPS